MKYILILFVAFALLLSSCEEVNYNTSGGPVSSISSAMPNPAKDQLNITFSVVQNANLKLSVESLTGSVLWEQPDNMYAAGFQMISIDASGFGSGIFVFKIRADKYIYKQLFEISK